MKRMVALCTLLLLAAISMAGAEEVPMSVRIPMSLQVEHEAIHAELVRATQAPGQVGVAASGLARVLHAHFEREEQIAMPPLGLLQSLADGSAIDEAQVTEVLAMTDSLRQELPRMLAEHEQIRSAVEALRVAAQADQNLEAERLAEDLAIHARNEEEVLYPAALLVGEVLRLRQQGR